MSTPGAPGFAPVVTSAGFTPPPSYVPKPSGFQTASNLAPRWDANINWFDFPPGQFVRLRFIGPVTKVYQHWLKTKKSQKMFPLFCLDWDIKAQQWREKKCPVEKNLDLDDVHKECKARFSGLSHVIVRDYPQPGQSYLMPIRVPAQVMITLEKIAQINLHVVDGVTYKVDVTDPYYGMDVFIHYDPKNNNNKYTVQQGQGSSPLAQNEMGFLSQLYNWGEIIVPNTFEDIERALKQNEYIGSAAVPPGILPGMPVPPQHTVGGMPHMGGLGQPLAVAPPGVMVASIPSVPTAPVGMPMAPAAPVVPQGMPVMQQMAPAAPVYSPPVQMMPPGVAPMGMQPAPMGMPQAAPAPMPMQATVAQPAYVAPTVPPPQSMVQPPMQPNPVVPLAQPVAAQTVAPAAPGGDARVFLVMGKGQVDAAGFQSEIVGYANSLPRGNPMKLAGGGEIEGFQVLACYGSYKGDAACIRCPIRKYCLDAKP